MATIMQPAIEIDRLTKLFGKRAVLDEVSLSIPHGSIFGLVGPNGAGKSTLLRMAAGLFAPDTGTISILGLSFDRNREAVLRSLGVMMEGFSLPERLTGSELLMYTARLREMRDDWRERASDLLRIFNLEDATATLIIDYSTGMRKKIGLALALLHRPQVLILDEPFEAIDPISAMAIESVLKQFVEGGGTVLLSSHLMDVVGRVCTNVAFVNHGKVIMDGRVDSLRNDGSLNDLYIDLIGAPPQERVRWLS